MPVLVLGPEQQRREDADLDDARGGVRRVRAPVHRPPPARGIQYGHRHGSRARTGHQRFEGRSQFPVEIHHRLLLTHRRRDRGGRGGATDDTEAAAAGA
ncbi:hypothetical protein [Streptomyces sp. NPDC001743]|uniref:hypothetical protein n=1 Tax=Streptomyces sp. NPDC001743 TaxID=3154397 RepID=UPI00332F8DA2